MLQSVLMQKAGIATQEVARIMFTLEAGDKIPTVTQLTEQLTTARGNVQFALTNLKKLGAIQLKPRGHLGTYITGIDYMLLAEVCGVKSLVGVMPLPYSKKYEGLATGLYSTLNKGSLQANIAFMRGSTNRLDLLLGSRYDFVIMSRLAYRYYEVKGHPLTCVATFGKQTYVNQHVTIARKGFSGSWAGKKIGVDSSSVDHTELTKSYFENKQVELVPLMYNQILTYLTDGTIDAAVWNIDDLNVNRDNVQVLGEAEAVTGFESTEAILACRKNDVVCQRLIRETLDIALVAEQQKMVEDGRMIPRY